MSDFEAQAVAEYRQARPEDDDLPDEIIASLTPVRLRTASLAFADAFTDAVEPVRLALEWLADRFARR